MPPFVAFAGVLGGLAVVRWAYKTAVRINQELEEMRLSRVAEAAHMGGNPDAETGSGDRSVSPGLVTPFHTPSFRGDAKHRTRNLEIPGSPFGRPGMTALCPLCLDSHPRRRYGPARFKTPARA